MSTSRKAMTTPRTDTPTTDRHVYPSLPCSLSLVSCPQVRYVYTEDRYVYTEDLYAYTEDRYVTPRIAMSTPRIAMSTPRIAMSTRRIAMSTPRTAQAVFRFRQQPPYNEFYVVGPVVSTPPHWVCQRSPRPLATTHLWLGEQ